jgi:hypothetical protein
MLPGSCDEQKSAGQRGEQQDLTSQLTVSS